MNKYLLTALVWKMFSMNSATKALYRKLGNTLGSGRRLKLNSAYLERGDWLVEKIRHYNLSADGGGSQFLELGTGWMHFFSVYLRLFFEYEGTLFDVWDNRQLNALKANFSQVPGELSINKSVSAEEIEHVHDVVSRIIEAESFDVLYALLSFEYVLSPSGSLDMLPHDQYDLVFSMDVLEHVGAEFLAESIEQYFRVLKPGGYSIHQIGVDDHLSHYAKGASRKQYLAYSDRYWNMLYRNDVQYFNRVSFDQFREYFKKAGFLEVEAYAEREPDALKGFRIAEQYRNQSRESLDATRVFLIYQKP